MKTLNLSLISALIAGIVPLSTAWAHASLERATPAKDAIVTTAPATVVLKFNEKVEEEFSMVKVFDATGHDVGAKKLKPEPADTAVLHAQLPPLKSGIYTVKWVAVGHDGHRRGGNYRFTVK